MSKKRQTTGLPKRKSELRSPGETLIQQGKIAFRRKDYDLAIIRWQMARSQHTLRAEARDKLISALAEAYFRRGAEKLVGSAAAAEDFREAAALQLQNALYTYYVALGWHRENRLTQAVEWYRKTLELDPTFSRAPYPLALALVESGEDATHDVVWEQLSDRQRAYLQHTPAGDPLSRAMALMAQDEWEQAAPVLNDSLKGEYPALAHYYLGIIAGRAGNDSVALEHWQRAYDAGLNTPHLLNNLTLAYTLRAEAALAEGHHAEALDNAEMGLAIDLSHPRLGDIQAQIHFERGYQAAEQGNWKRARDEWVRVENATGANARSLAANVAIAHEKLEQWTDAAEAWREFARRRPRKKGSEGWLAPKQVARLWTRISELYLKAGIPEEAITTLQNALKYQPDDVELGLSLARCYISDERPEAAHHQLDHVLKLQPDHVETLVLKAELTEVAPPNRWYSPFNSDPPGAAEWQVVLAIGDKSYAPLAKEHLKELYEAAFEEAWEWSGPALACEKALKGLAIVPDDHFLRARYVFALLMSMPKGKKARSHHEAEVREQVDLVDLTDEQALHQLIDAWHTTNRHADAAATLDLANAARQLGSEFYVGIGGCALNRKQVDIAERYFDETLSRATDETERRHWQATIGAEYAGVGNEAKAESIWRDILKEDPAHGYAHYHLWILNYRRNNRREAQKHLQQARRWAGDHHDDNLKASIEQTKDLFDNPLSALFSALPPGLDPSLIPPDLLGDMLERFLGEGAFDDDFDDDFDLDLPPFGRRG